MRFSEVAMLMPSSIDCSIMTMITSAVVLVFTWQRIPNRASSSALVSRAARLEAPPPQRDLSNSVRKTMPPKETG